MRYGFGCSYLRKQSAKSYIKRERSVGEITGNISALSLVDVPVKRLRTHHLQSTELPYSNYEERYYDFTKDYIQSWKKSYDDSSSDEENWILPSVPEITEDESDTDSEINEESVIKEILGVMFRSMFYLYEIAKETAPDLKLQAEDMADMENEAQGHAEGSAIIQQQTVEFIDNAVGEIVDKNKEVNSIAMIDNTEDVSLGNFLMRPTLIDSTIWTTTSTGVLKQFNPWNLYLANTVIRRKLENYTFIRGNLHIKILMNGTPFQYGALRLVYTPLLGFMQPKFDITSPLATYNLSQMPGFYIYPQANAGGEMTLPFLLHKNWLDMTSNEETVNMGTLRMYIYSQLRLATDTATNNLTLKTYAYMSDVHLMGPTTRLLLQAKDDEYGNGPVSGPATAIASAAGMLGKIPIIGPFARATQIGASAVSAIAKLFGYTNVPVIDNVHGFQPMNAPMLASSHISTQLQKLSLDPKQELNIDPALHGCGDKDELSLAYILMKESFFFASIWQSIDLPGKNLLSMRVTPLIEGTTAINNAGGTNVGQVVASTPIAYMSRMFDHWRGDVILRIKVVCTKFHKGRIRVSFDPRGTLIDNLPSENQIYTEIIDIGEMDDISIRIPYHQDLPWLRCPDFNAATPYSSTSTLSPNIGTDNGTIKVEVLTELVSPNSSPVDLLFYFRAAENFEFNNPCSSVGDAQDRRYSFFQLQSEDTTDIVSRELSMGAPSTAHPERYGLNFGENICSLRNLIHRAMTHENTPLQAPPAGTQYALYGKLYKRMPYTPGFTPGVPTAANNVIAATGTSPYLFVGMHPLPYITSMYVGYRGSTNYYITPSSDKYGYIDDMRLTRLTDVNNVLSGNLLIGSNFANIPRGTSISNQYYQMQVRGYLRDGLAGMAINSTKTNGSLTVNFPDYNNRTFAFADPSQYFFGNATDGTVEQNMLLTLNLKTASSTDTGAADSVTIHTAVGAGPDFTCLFFLSCPFLYVTNTFVTPA